MQNQSTQSTRAAQTLHIVLVIWTVLWWSALFIALAMLVTPHQSFAYNCGGREWPSISVSLSNNLAGESSSYTIASAVPSLDGCDLTTSTQLSLVFPGDTDVELISGATLNGFAITNYVVKSGNTLTFVSPIAVDNGIPVNIILNNVTNDSTQGSKNLTLSAMPVRTGSIGTTLSSPFQIAVRTPTPTNTATATFTATPTRTITATRTTTATQTISATPTASYTATPGLCVGSASTNPCAPGGGAKATDCVLEWLTRPIPFPDRNGIPKNKLRCYEGDPRCDADPDLHNSSCTFELKVCINNQDPRLSTCVASDVQLIEVKEPNPSRLRDTADVDNLRTLEENCGLGGLGLTVMRQNARVFVGQPNATPNACTEGFEIAVPLRRTAGGRYLKRSKKLRLAGATSHGRNDTDTLHLECRPSTCGDGIVQGDHESCDDGNRITGDGCDQSCRVE